MPVAKRTFPVSRADVDLLLTRLGVPAPALDRETYDLDDFVAAVGAHDSLLAIDVHKRREHYTVGGCMAELSEIRTPAGTADTIAIESPDPALVLTTVRALGLSSRMNVCMGRGLKALAGFGAQRYTVIDVGTNSVKLHIGERHADGSWSSVVDRAAVTRLGEGLDATGSLGPEPMARTTEAIAEMADESRRAGAAAIAAVGTAGLRAAENGAAFVGAVESRCGVQIEIIPGSEEARLAYLAAKAGLGIAGDSVVVFDTGGGSSQFTFGRGDDVEEQFSVPVGAVRLTERHGLDGTVTAESLRDVLDRIAAELDGLDARPKTDALVGMGGALTNLAAVKLELAEYDPDIVQGRRLDPAEIDRQIELYRLGRQTSGDPSSASSRTAPRSFWRGLRRARGAEQARLRLAGRERPRAPSRVDRRPLRRSARRSAESAAPLRRPACVVLASPPTDDRQPRR